MTRPLLASIQAGLVLVAFFLGSALGPTPRGLGAALAVVAIAASITALFPVRNKRASPSASTQRNGSKAERSDPEGRASASSASRPAETDEQANLLPEELADRYYTNFLVPIRATSIREDPAPARIQVLIPESPSMRNTLRNAVRAECRSVAITPDRYARQFGIYVHAPAQAASSTIVDVPTILHGRSSSRGAELPTRVFYDRFADRLSALLKRESSTGLPVRVYRNVRSFPLNE